MVEEMEDFSEHRPDTRCPRRCSIPIPAVSRSLELDVHSSDSYGYHSRSTSAAANSAASRDAGEISGLVGRNRRSDAIKSSSRPP